MKVFQKTKKQLGLPVVGLVLSMLYTIAIALYGPIQEVGAASLSNWDAGRIIDDAVFVNSTTMNTSSIQNFLNSKVPVCDTNGVKASEYGGGTRAQWGQANYNQSTFTCLKDYSEGGKSAAEIIYSAAQEFSINPQVLIVLLQKEQGLVTDEWPLSLQYKSATGYGCPDTSVCDSQYYGFTNQVRWSAKMFRAIMNASPTWYTPYLLGVNYIQYNPDKSCGGSNVNILNRATQALYNYTPYQPNKDALAVGYGSSGSCGAYGNRNFYLYFTDWFGSTTGPDYAWQIVSYSYAGGDNNIAVGETETITLKARNVGRNPWYNHGSNVVRLATWEPAERISSLFGKSRLASLQESVVNVGEDGTFTFSITPSKEGTYAEGLNLVAENAMFMPWVGFRPTINITSSYAWAIERVIYENGTGVMNPGTSQLITVVAKNIGSNTWSKMSGPAIKLATWQPDRQSAVGATWLSRTRVALMNEASVAPGQTAGFQFYVTMPPGGGYFYERLNLVAEGQRWFQNQDLTLYLYGRQYAWEPLWHSHSTGTANIPKNTDFTVTLKARNVGDASWSKSESFPLYLGTARPMNRASTLYSPSWYSESRPARLVEDIVVPGGTGTFVIPLRTNAVQGPRCEYFRPVAEGLIWLNDPGFCIYVNVI